MPSYISRSQLQHDIQTVDSEKAHKAGGSEDAASGSPSRSRTRSRRLICLRNGLHNLMEAIRAALEYPNASFGWTELLQHGLHFGLKLMFEDCATDTEILSGEFEEP
ncbi:hypothetical protein BDQ17DRAFT_1439421 [Cyathus striatus]|nr:hypothetical protein BDQ17DRAFT_1439421 [Cyathus striatus]